MHKGVKIVLMTLLWVFVVAFVVFFNGRARHHRANTTVHSLRVSILDSLRDEMLVTSDAVERWIAHSKIPTLGVPVGEIDLDAIEQCIRGNGFIDRVSAYVTYGGELRVEVSQRRPLLRLMVDGYDCYVTGEGFVFPAPRLASVYVPVVTGSYRPPVPKGYVGRVEDYIAEQIAKSQAQADTLQYEKVPLFKATQDIADSVRSVRRMQVERFFRAQGVGFLRHEALVQLFPGALAPQEILCAVDGHPDQPGLAVFLVMKDPLFFEVGQKRFRENIVSVCRIGHIAIGDLIDHIRICPHNCFFVHLIHP